MKNTAPTGAVGCAINRSQEARLEILAKRECGWCGYLMVASQTPVEAEADQLAPQGDRAVALCRRLELFAGEASRVPAPPDLGMLVVVSNEKAKEWSRNAFNRRAAKYEKSLAARHSRGMKEAALRHLDRPIRGSLLDVGCGPGLLLEVLVGQGGELNLAGLDIAPEMIRVAKERLGARADLRVGDAESLPWEDGRFDYILCVDSFHHYPNPGQVLAQMHRVLKRSGRLVIADPWAPPVLRQMANLVNPLLRMGDVRMYGKREMMRMLEARGFEKTESETSGLWGFVVTALAR